MATDIAIVTGVVALIGTRAPSWLKLFLLALAIVDDIGAIIVIAIFYSEGVSFEWLAVAIGAVAVAATIRNTMPYVGVYVLLGAICWLGLHEAHVHPTLTGVAFGMLAPVTPRRTPEYVDANDLLRNPTSPTAHRVTRPGARDRVGRRVARAPAAPLFGVHRSSRSSPSPTPGSRSPDPSSVTPCRARSRGA